MKGIHTQTHIFFIIIVFLIVINLFADFINRKFLHFLFEKLEDVVKEGEEEIGQNLLNILLSFNLHFHEGQENLVLEALRERNSAQALTEKLVFLLNREGKIVNLSYILYYCYIFTGCPLQMMTSN